MGSVVAPYTDERLVESAAWIADGPDVLPVTRADRPPPSVRECRRGREVAAQAPLRSGHLDLGDDAARRRIPTGELDTGCLSDQAASPVAPDEVLRPQRPALGQLDVDARIVLCEPRHLAAAMDRHGQLVDPFGQDALDVVLPQSEPVRVPGWEVADVEADPREPRDLSFRPLREEPVAIPRWSRTSIVRACRPPARAGQLLGGAPLDDGDVDPRQRQLARQHQARRASSGDHDRMRAVAGQPLALGEEPVDVDPRMPAAGGVHDLQRVGAVTRPLKRGGDHAGQSR